MEGHQTQPPGVKGDFWEAIAVRLEYLIIVIYYIANNTIKIINNTTTNNYIPNN